MRGSWRLIFISIILLGVFSPTPFGELITADDTLMVDNLRANDHLTFSDLFFGSRANMFYYRPLLMTTYLFDKAVWSFDPFAMRFENVLIHLVSVLAIYMVLVSALRLEKHENSWLPFLGALLFGLNPVVTESVNWVSGRSDLLAGSFVFLSALAILKFKETCRSIFFAVAILFVICALLCKEVAFAFLPGALLLLSAGQLKSHPGSLLFRYWFRPLVIICIVLVGAGVFIYFRSLAVFTSALSVRDTMNFILNDPFYSGIVVFRLIGFYLKKMFLPWPLNFVILDVDPLYELLGMALSLVCLWAFFSRKYAAAFFLSGMLLLAPAFPVAFNRIAWTPYAERYVYVASGFVTVAFVLYMKDRLSFKQLNYGFSGLVVIVLVMFSVSSWERNKAWQTNETLWWDTMKKSPDSSVAINEYGLVMLRKGELDRAIEYLKKATKNRQSIAYKPSYDIDLASAYEQAGLFFETEEVYARVLEKTNNRSSLAWQGLQNLYENELQRENPRIDRRELKVLLSNCCAQ